mmetsp:Transcript_20655/g.19882  ORF Transcript_20655/g.19882 Transcript_20655/m.19882 type:complete len:225 (+) Transcript_20655:364-1038(+)
MVVARDKTLDKVSATSHARLSFIDPLRSEDGFGTKGDKALLIPRKALPRSKRASNASCSSAPDRSAKPDPARKTVGWHGKRNLAYTSLSLSDPVDRRLPVQHLGPQSTSAGPRSAPSVAQPPAFQLATQVCFANTDESLLLLSLSSGERATNVAAHKSAAHEKQSASAVAATALVGESHVAMIMFRGMRAMTSRAAMDSNAWTPPLPRSSGNGGRKDSLGVTTR